MILQPDLFSFAYIPEWYIQLDALAEMALPESWRFRNPIYLTKNPDTPILERYIHAIFKKQLIDYKDERNPSKAAEMFHIENEHACFHTGLYTPRYKAIYACFWTEQEERFYAGMVFQGVCGRVVSPAPVHIAASEEAPLLYDAEWRQLQPGMADPSQCRPHPGR